MLLQLWPIKLVLLVSLETVFGGCAMVAVAVVFGWWLDAVVDGALLLGSECVVFEPVFGRSIVLVAG